MNHAPRFHLGMIIALALGAGCAGPRQQGASASFAAVQSVLESNCVHCHGQNRLSQMPAFTDTGALARLIGPANWIVPGQPERSRFFQVISLADNQVGAMPPTGHAISQAEVGKIRAWIVAGAPLPEGAPIVFNPRGPGPRSL